MIAYACILCRLLVSAREQPQQVYASEAGDAASSSYEVDEFVKVKDNSGSKSFFDPKRSKNSSDTAMPKILVSIKTIVSNPLIFVVINLREIIITSVKINKY